MTNDELLKFYERQFGPFVHMGPADKAIWLRYLMQGGAQFAPFSYDVRVGEGVTLPPGSTVAIQNLAYALTTKRIDVVCKVGSITRIIEVKLRAGLGAIGQLIGYDELWHSTFGGNWETEKWLITDVLQPDMKPLLLSNDIHFFEVGI